jgi:hopene-associated glycosyltransferase HpnB
MPATLSFLIGAMVAASAILWLAILLLPWQPWRNNEILPLPDPSPEKEGLEDVTVVIPARNEAPLIGRTLSSLARQGQGLRVVVVDDGSSDGTAEAAAQVPGLDVTVVPSAPLPPGWMGKVWALEQGTRRVLPPLTLLIDADIALGQGVLHALKDQMHTRGYHFVSIMASLHMHSFWEKLLAPSFIYFFKMLYPFRLAKTQNPRFYSAAGGCILVETQALRAIGGWEPIHSELIDDCALARQVKRAGFRTWIGQSRAVQSIRPYEALRDIWEMVARSAFTQLRHSPVILLLMSLCLVVLFFAAPLGWLGAGAAVRWLALLTWLMMIASYVPTLLYYELSPGWALLMPLTGALYLGMTWSSALRFWRGEAGRWKGRVVR